MIQPLVCMVAWLISSASFSRVFDPPPCGNSIRTLARPQISRLTKSLEVTHLPETLSHNKV